MRPTPGTRSTPAGEFLDASRTLLTEEYMPRLLKCTGLLSEADLWWRPNEASNSIGNMLLHMCGNLRQWIVGGAGGLAVERDRPAEFAARETAGRAELIDRLQATVAEVDLVLAGIPEDSLLDRITIQGFEVTRLHAVYHSIEHFSYHLGPIAYVTKLRTGKDLEVFP